MKRKNFPKLVQKRREKAIEILLNTEFVEKEGRTREEWQARKDEELEILRSRVK